MASVAKKTKTRRAIRRAKSGKVRKRYIRNNGTTAPLLPLVSKEHSDSPLTSDK